MDIDFEYWVAMEELFLIPCDFCAIKSERKSSSSLDGPGFLLYENALEVKKIFA